MPRFYFDIRDGESLVVDEVGLEFPTVNEARDDASRTLGQMMKEAMPDGQHHDVAVEVRGDDKRPLFRVQITFEVHSLARDEPPPR
jgi:hypothetical protein